MTSPTLDISADEFRLWLEARRGDIVGRWRNWCACPVSNWLSDKAGHRISVSTEEFADNWKRSALPVWAQRFIAEVDREAGGYIDGETALSILAGALRSAP